MRDNPKITSPVRTSPRARMRLPFLYEDATVSATSAPLSNDTDALAGIDTGITWQHHN